MERYEIEIEDHSRRYNVYLEEPIQASKNSFLKIQNYFNMMMASSLGPSVRNERFGGPGNWIIDKFDLVVEDGVLKLSEKDLEKCCKMLRGLVSNFI